jgi:hypothetical protein
MDALLTDHSLIRSALASIRSALPAIRSAQAAIRPAEQLNHALCRREGSVAAQAREPGRSQSGG